MKAKNNLFKPYQQNQLMVLPPTLDELIPKEHPVRVVNQVIDKINLEPLLSEYKGGGCSSYHPRMLLKVLVYGYLNNIYSSRKIEAAIKENIHFMWLSGMQKPDHNTINRFRSQRLKEVIHQVFNQVVLLLSESGQIDIKEVYIDGTKIEANANRYTFVWGRAIKTNKERIVKQLNELWEYTQKVTQQELSDTSPLNFDTIDPQRVQQTIEEINEALKQQPIDKKVKQKLRYVQKNWPEKLKEYQQKEQMIGQRNNCSKTDVDATFMRMKEDHMKNGQLKPGYNVQISTNNQYIVHYSLHQTSTDTTTLIPHLESYKEILGGLPQEVIADAGYGSLENYEYLEDNDIEAYVKYSYFDREQRRNNKDKSPFHVDNLFYNKEQNCYYCPMGQVMRFIGEKVVKSDNGHERVVSLYQATNCTGCPLRGACHKSKKNRIIEVCHRLKELKAKAKELLLSEKGIFHRKRRPVEVEAVFGMLKQNKGFRRFITRGLKKVTVEFGLLAMAHNLQKIIVNQEITSFLSTLLEFIKGLLNTYTGIKHVSLTHEMR